VSTLTVTNSDGSSAITSPAFGGWTTGASYAWTHSSTETTQTITWTIGGNTVRLPFTVTKDGSPFVAGTVDDAGQVVFTMLGSDPNMRVTVQVPVVIPPPGPGWWQDPYMVLILPRIFLGVAIVAKKPVSRKRTCRPKRKDSRSGGSGSRREPANWTRCTIRSRRSGAGLRPTGRRSMRRKKT